MSWYMYLFTFLVLHCYLFHCRGRHYDTDSCDEHVWIVDVMYSLPRLNCRLTRDACHYILCPGAQIWKSSTTIHCNTTSLSSTSSQSILEDCLRAGAKSCQLSWCPFYRALFWREFETCSWYKTTTRPGFHTADNKTLFTAANLSAYLHSPKNYKTSVFASAKDSRTRSSNQLMWCTEEFWCYQLFLLLQHLISLAFMWCQILRWRYDIPNSNISTPVGGTYTSSSQQWSSNTGKKSIHQYTSNEC